MSFFAIYLFIYFDSESWLFAAISLRTSEYAGAVCSDLRQTLQYNLVLLICR